MRRAGVRELRQNASELLRRVARGETIEITDRGRAVARLTPLPDTGPYERLVAEGEIEPARGDLSDAPPPVRLPAGSVAPSVALARLREDER